MGVKLGAAPPGFQPVDPGPAIEDGPSLPPLHTVFGAYRRADGIWELPELTARTASTSGSLHIGPIHIILEAAATDLVAQMAGTDAVQIEDWSVDFVSRGTHGPFIVDGVVAGRKGGTGRLSTGLRDQGRDSRIVASAVAIFSVAG